MPMNAVGEGREASVGTVRVALHQLGVQVRRGGFASRTDEGRSRPDDLYGDPKFTEVLARHVVVVPEERSPAGPFDSLARLPLATGLVRELYEGVRLPILHITGLAKGR